MKDENKVESLSDFINWSKEIKQNSAKNKDVFFRGQSNKEWNLTPSIFRDDYDEYDLMIRGRAHLSSFDKSNTSYIESMIEFQHFGLPTRLLDVTSNPFVALFVACNTMGGDGVVYSGEDDPLTYSDIDAIASAYFKSYSKILLSAK